MEHHSATATDTPKVGILVRDRSNQRLIESAATYLQLQPVLITSDDLHRRELFDLELLIADEEPATMAVEFFTKLKRRDDPARPAVLMTFPATFDINDQTVKSDFDGILPMPQTPAALAAQLSVALYAHRASTRRYENALEELYLNRRIFHSVMSGISVANATHPDLVLSYVNPSFEAMTGYTLEEVEGRNCRFLQGDDTDQPGLTLLREAIRNGRGTVAVLKNYRKDGTAFWNELVLSPIRSRAGKLTHFVGVQTDVTERVEFETAIRESEKLAVVGRLSAAIAHEINNPLESLMNLVYLAERSEPEDTRQYLAMMDQELRRMKLITAQSLRFSRQSHRPEAIQPTELLDSILLMQKARIEGVGVAVDRRDRFSDSIVCMEGEIRQVINNLVSNATDAAKGKGQRLWVRTRPATDLKAGRSGILITIADNGVGMSSRTRQKMFEAFFTTKGNQGTGLGLWVSKGIVDRHHGRIRVRSRTEQQDTGTVFQVFLPYQGASDSTASGDVLLSSASRS